MSKGHFFPDNLSIAILAVLLKTMLSKKKYPSRIRHPGWVCFFATFADILGCLWPPLDYAVKFYFLRAQKSSTSRGNHARGTFFNATVSISQILLCLRETYHLCRPPAMRDRFCSETFTIVCRGQQISVSSSECPYHRNHPRGSM